MSAIDLSRYLRPPRRAPRKAWLVTFLLVAGTGWLGIAGYRLHAENRMLEDRISLLRERVAAQAASKPTRVSLDEQKRWIALRLERDFPWERVFRAVERADSRDIELLEFQPDKRNRVIVLRGEAKDDDALVAYLEALTLQASLANVHLLHQEKVTRDRLETVSFEIKATLVD